MILNPIKRYYLKFLWKIWFWILLKDMVLNIIDRYNFKFHWKTCFWMSLKDQFLNVIERYDFECNWMIWFWISFEKNDLNIIKILSYYEIVFKEFWKFLFCLHLYLHFLKGYQQEHNNRTCTSYKMKIYQWIHFSRRKNYSFLGIDWLYPVNLLHHFVRNCLWSNL